MVGFCVNKLLITSAVVCFLCSSCVKNTNISYFPDQRGPLYCHLAGDGRSVRPPPKFYEFVPIPNWPKAFVLRDNIANEAVVIANEASVLAATAQPIYQSHWGKEELIAVKLLVEISLVQDRIVVDEATKYLKFKFPGVQTSDTVLSDTLIQVYSIWLGSEYTRTPCDGVISTMLPFEMTLAADEGIRFLRDTSEDLQIAGLIVYNDVKTGWKINKSFSLNRSQFKVKKDLK